MTLNLDIRAPIIVLIADYNPAIFTLPWIAQYLFGHNEGEEVEVFEVGIQSGNINMSLPFIHGVAFNVSSNRTEIFMIDAEPETLGRVEQVILRMLEVLPHTPLRAIGCNFGYIDNHPEPHILDLFKTPEGLEGEGVLNRRQLGVQLQLDEGGVLNYARFLMPELARFTFNYHQSETDPNRYKDFVPGLIGKSLSHSEMLLKSLYRYEGHGVLGFNPEAAQEEDGIVTEAAN